MARPGARRLAFALLALVAAGAAIFVFRARDSSNDGPREAGGTKTSAVWQRGNDERPRKRASVEGTVLDPDGHPAPAATIVLVRIPTQVGLSRDFIPAITARVREDGGFRVDDVFPGSYNATAMAEGFGPARVGPFVVPEVGSAHVELRLTREGFLLSGQVMEVGGGEIPGATVRATDGALTLETTSDSKGEYRLPVGTGEYAVVIEAEGYLRAQYTIVLAGDISRDVRLTPAARVAGHAITGRGREPVADATVWLTPLDRDSHAPPMVKTDARGSFSFPRVEAGTFRASARKGRLLGQGAVLVVGATTGANDVEILMEPAPALSGHVLSSSGKGFVGAGLSLRSQSSLNEPPVTVQSDAAGAYKFEGVSVGIYLLDASAKGRLSASRQLSVTTDRDDVNLILVEPSALAGHVMDADGRPVTGAEVRVDVASPVGAERKMGQSRADGSFEIKPLRAGRILVVAQHPEHGISTVVSETLMETEQKNVTIKLERGASVAGMVQREDGSPVSGANVTAWIDAGVPRHQWRDSTGADGKYSLAPLPAGRVFVVAHRSGLPPNPDEVPNQQAIDLAAGEHRTDVNLVIPGGKAIRGIVVGPESKPLAGAEVMVESERDAQVQLEAGADGRFTVEDVGPGPFVLWAVHDGLAGIKVKGVAGGTTGLRLQMVPSARISGTVTTRGGAPLPEYSVRLIGSSLASVGVRDPNGAFELSNVPPGLYKLRASARDGSAGSATVELHLGENKEGVRIVADPGASVVGRVVDQETGAPLASVEVQTTSTSGWRYAVTDARGAFELVGISSGDVAQITFNEPADHLPEVLSVEIAPGRAEIDAGTVALKRLVHGSLGQ